MRIKPLLAKSFQKLSDDHRFVRLSAFATMSHSLVLLGTALYYTNAVLQHNNTGVNNGEILEYVFRLLENPALVGTGIALGLILLIGYVIIYPVGQAGILFYCKDDMNSGSRALMKGFSKFFLLFEFGALRGIGLSLISFLFILSRLYVMELLDLLFIQILIGVWLFIIFVIDVLWAYADIVIVAEDLTVWEAIKRSAGLSMEHLGVTVQSVLLKIVLFVRFGLNMLVVLGVPTAMLWVAYFFGGLEAGGFERWLAGTVVFLMIAMAYINGIIEGFFVYYRRQLYEKITNKGTEEPSNETNN